MCFAGVIWIWCWQHWICNWLGQSCSDLLTNHYINWKKNIQLDLINHYYISVIHELLKNILQVKLPNCFTLTCLTVNWTSCASGLLVRQNRTEQTIMISLFSNVLQTKWLINYSSVIKITFSCIIKLNMYCRANILHNVVWAYRRRPQTVRQNTSTD